jgi:hypothetical protein
MWQAERVTDSSFDAHLAGDGIAYTVNQPRIDDLKNLTRYRLSDLPCRHRRLPC